MKEVEFFKYLDIGKDEFYNLRHVHNESYEILLTLSGGGTFFIRDRLFNLYQNAIYFTNKAESHYSVPETPENYYRRKIIISADFVDELTQISSCTQLIDDLFRKKGGMCIIPNEETVDFVNKEFLNISNALAENSMYTNAKVASSIMNIICAAHNNIEEQAPQSESKVSQVLRYINKNLSTNITLEEICEHSHFSKYYLCHIFKKTVGMTIFEYILSRRLSIAKKYLLNTDMPLSQIADTTGFSSFAYFSKAFRESEGITPSKFRSQKKS